MSTSTSTTSAATAPVTPIMSESKSTSHTETTETKTGSTSPKRRSRQTSSSTQPPASKPSKATDQTKASPEEVEKVLQESGPVLLSANQQKSRIEDLSGLQAGAVSKTVDEHQRLRDLFLDPNGAISQADLDAHKATIDQIKSALDVVETFVLDGDHQTLVAANAHTDERVETLHRNTALGFEQTTATLVAVEAHATSNTARLDNIEPRLTNVERLVTPKPPVWTYVVALIGGFVVWYLFWAPTWSTSTKLKDGQVLTQYNHLDDWEIPVIFGVLAALIVWGIAMAFVLLFRKVPVPDRPTVETEHETIVLPAQSDAEPARPNAPTKALKADAGATQTPA